MRGAVVAMTNADASRRAGQDVRLCREMVDGPSMVVMTTASGTLQPCTSGPPIGPRTARRRRPLLAGLELGTGVAAVIGGLLLAIAPDGSLLDADPAALAASPFRDYRIPGLLLAGLVGGGYLVTGGWQWRAGRSAAPLSLLAGLGLIAFEAAELRWLGFQPLEAVFAVIGGIVAAAAIRDLRAPH